MIFSNQIAIIADDLTGANDTALQFQKRGVETNILLDYNNITEANSNLLSVWATSTETRNIAPDEAIEKIEEAVKSISTSLNIEHFYKKIDSTMRGNIAVETLAMIEILEMDASVIIPAFPTEGRITVGGYHLLKTVPIGRSEIAQDPYSPIGESHLPTLLAKQLNGNEELIGHLNLKTIMNGAGPVLMKINELIKEGKKLIIADAVSIIDIEQIILAINKSEYNILPTGTAAAAAVLSEIWLPEKTSYIAPEIPKLSTLIISGSATDINSNQIEKFKNSDEFNDSYEVALSQKDIIEGVTDDIINSILEHYDRVSTILVHSSYLVDNFDGFSDETLNAELTKLKFANMITDYLAELTRRVIERKRVFLVTLGGETSYKCCSAINAMELSLISEVGPAIGVCVDKNEQYIITKSGNIGNTNTLIDIVKYINRHEQI